MRRRKRYSIAAQDRDFRHRNITGRNLRGIIKKATQRNKEPAQAFDSVATILERETKSTIQEWIARVSTDEKLSAIKLDGKSRSCHLPQLFKDLVNRLRNPLPVGAKSKPSKSAQEHGLTRRKQGYPAALLIEESRILQVSIFDTLRKNSDHVDLNLLLLDVMVIADEADSQLAQAMTSYIG